MGGDRQNSYVERGNNEGIKNINVQEERVFQCIIHSLKLMKHTNNYLNLKKYHKNLKT